MSPGISCPRKQGRGDAYPTPKNARNRGFRPKKRHSTRGSAETFHPRNGLAAKSPQSSDVTGPSRDSNPGLIKNGGRNGGRIERNEMAKVLLDEIVRTLAQLARLQMVSARRAEEGISRMSHCEECERLWKAYETATIQSVQLYEEIESMTEDWGLQKLSDMTTKAEVAERARQRLAEHQASTGHR